MKTNRTSGLTLVEVSIAVSLGAIISGIVLNVGVETMKFTSYADQEFVAQSEANRGFDRVAEAIRKIGWNTAAGVTYPRVINGGDELQLRLLSDLDGNGYAFDAVTGDLEWNPEIFSIRRDPTENVLAVFDQSGDLVWTCARSITDVTFVTSVEDPALHFKEVRVEITGSRVTTDGTTVSFTAAGSVHMRN